MPPIDLFRETAAPPARGALGGAGDWFVFAAARDGQGGLAVPGLLSFAHLARTTRNALLKLGPQPPPQVISGHAPDGKAASAVHLAVVPLADVGRPDASGDLAGLAVVLPRAPAEPDRRAVLSALAAFASLSSPGTPQGSPQGTTAPARAALRLPDGRLWHLERQAAPALVALRPDRYCAAATVWASVTPLLLDRYADRDDPGEEAAIIAAACRNLGLPDPAAIEIGKRSPVRAAPAAYADRGRPDWSFPVQSKLRLRPRRHVVLRFAEPVAGPVLLGAGRYQGFGLCLPIPA